MLPVPVPFFFVSLCISKYNSEEGGGGGGAYIWRGDLTEGFLRYEFGGLIFGRAYFRNFTVREEEGNSADTLDNSY